MAASAPGLQSCSSIVSSGEADQWMSASRPDAFATLRWKARHATFTPMKVATCQVNAAAVGDLHVTVGEFLGGGSFCKVEAWKTMQEPHGRLPKPLGRW